MMNAHLASIDEGLASDPTPGGLAADGARPVTRLERALAGFVVAVNVAAAL
jgi:hypothetical protein